MKSILLTLFMVPLLLCSDKTDTINNEIKNESPVVLELFTSQGCSSCPPADELLNEVKSNKVIALSYHVDYWNYIGWKDPFSKEKYSNKQRRYASKFNSSSIYTPQIVVNGKEHFVGSNESILKNKISEYSKKTSKNYITISEVSKSNNKIDFKYGTEGNLQDQNLRIVLVINQRTTSVKRGENRNRELVNSNIVVNEQLFNLKSNSMNGSILIPEMVRPEDELSLILIVENDKLDILTATQKAV
ncbi:DUF1223 domain-containing protein [Winogradskyella ursingii]|uniref:DUF1223 domain-containing protein n=1 Tax=Winogradskyella ursingii TaxID=2686079 RepID=UPI0015CE73C4|nr:DUF1223 domain-containing protein [Winogradskyella ursingii]